MQTLPHPSPVKASPADRESRLLEALPAIAWSASVETFRFTYVNRAAEKLLGYPIERWLNEHDFWITRIHPDDRYVSTLCHSESLAGRDHELVYRMMAADGRTVWIRDYVNVHSVDGQAVELFGIMIDITREREAEEAALEDRENFRRMVERSPDCIGVHVDGAYVYVNRALVQLLGANNEFEILGRIALSFVDPRDQELVRERQRKVTAGESVPYMRQTFLRMDGSPLDVEVAALPLRYGNREAVQIIARDVTDRARAQKALAASEQRYRALVEDVTDILYTVDAEGRFASLSRSFERSTGYRAEDWIGKPFADLFMPQSRPAAMDHFQQALAGNTGIIREYDLPDRAGAVVTVEVSSQPRYVDGVLAGTIGMARDVTEQRTIARKLEEAKRMSSLGQVTASLAHEFNNVLMGIQPFVEVIARNAPATRTVSDALGHITRSISRGKRASQEILRFANPKEPQLFPVDVRLWLPTLLGQLVASLPSSTLLESSIDPGVGFIRVDREHLEQVLTNLVFNARDAIAGSGTIHVGISRPVPATQGENDGDLVRITVSDDGPGIPHQLLERVFEPLFTTKRNGTGLGLAIARRLMERQGGSLTAENRQEGGTAFHLLVSAAEECIALAHPLSARTLGVRRILLVEDDLAVGSGLEQLLGLRGYETTWVRTAGEACAASLRTRPQVAIIDVNLPDGNGVELVEQLRAGNAELPVILSTGHVEMNISSEMKRTLALMKPYEMSDLLEAIGSVTAAA
ncbi:MAG: PAS domain S-box protein [Acidobacteriota bacterium]